jgi:hypothetical protein
MGVRLGGKRRRLYGTVRIHCAVLHRATAGGRRQWGCVRGGRAPTIP